MKKLNVYVSLIIISLFAVSNNAFSGSQGCYSTKGEWRFSGGVGYTSHNGSESSEDISGVEEPLEIDNRNIAYNLGLGFYDQPILNAPAFGCIKLSFNVKHGSSLKIDEANLETRQTDDIKYTIGLSFNQKIAEGFLPWLMD